MNHNTPLQIPKPRNSSSRNEKMLNLFKEIHFHKIYRHNMKTIL